MVKGLKPTYKHSTYVFECGICGQMKSFTTEKEMMHAKIRHNRVVHKTVTDKNIPITRRQKSLELNKDVVKHSEIIIHD